LEVHKNRENEAQKAQIGLLKENCDRPSTWLLADFPLMNFTQMQERLRVELLRRIQRGTLTVSLLARQTGFGKSHLSNFLHARRQLSLEGIDRMLTAQHMAAEDLLHLGAHSEHTEPPEEPSIVPVVSHGTALFEPYIRPSSVQMMLQLPPGALRLLKARPVSTRRSWQRFVAIRIAHADALPMDPLLFPDALAVIDRHYNSLAAYRAGRPNLYAIRNGAHLKLRYADFASARLMLRPLNMGFPVDLIEIGPDDSLGEHIAGRVVLTINEL
jgi:antitoxin component HigA of HigAB toxin-antitoxin module